MEELGDPPSPAEYRAPPEPGRSPTPTATTEKKQGDTSVIVASAAVLVVSALAFGLIGTGDIAHFVLLVCYGVAALSLGAFLVRPTAPESSHGVVTETPADVASALDGNPAVDDGGASRISALNGHGAVGYNTAMMCSSNSASPLHWVGETVEGSLSWLVGNRQRSSSAGGALQGNERGHGGSGSTVSSPGAGGDRTRVRTVRARSGALPAPQVPVSRVWPSISNGRQTAPEAAMTKDPIRGDESVDTDIEDEEEGRHESQAANEYEGGVRMHNGSETGSLSSVANGLREDGDISLHGEAAGELNWEVDGRRQMLRRSITSPGIPTEDNQMVQNLLEMISDKPVNHAGQWIPVRVRHGIHIWTSTMEGSPYCRIRGRMRCEATPAQLLSLLIDDERIGEYDRMFDRYELVERPNDQTSVRWTCYRAIWPTRPRDFVIRSTWEEFADGTIVIATRSVEHEEYPETPTFVRGTMVTCGYVLCPLGESRRRRRSSKQAALLASAAVETQGVLSSDGRASLRSPELRPSSEVTMYAHTDLGGYLPASVINKLCKKPAYRVLRKIQDMIETGSLVKRGDAGDGNTGGRVPGDGGNRSNMSRHDSEDLLGSLVAEGMPDLEAASNLEGGHESQGQQGDARRGSVGDGTGASRRNSMEPGPSTPSPLLPALSREVAIREAQRIMKTINRMASDESLGWSQLGVASHSDMALYKCPVLGTKKVRLGASTCVTGESSELVGILLENAAILGPDYILDRQELLETFNSGVNAVGGYSDASTGGEEGDPQHDTAIYWFSCTHKRQRICRDFVILRCFRPLPGCGGVIAYSSIDHPGLPPCPDYVRGRLDTSGFVILPSPRQDDEHRSRESRRKKRPNWGAGGGGNGHSQGGDSIENSDVGEDESGRGISSSGSNRGGNRGRRARFVGHEAAVSEVTFFTHLTFSAFLPDIQGMEACRHFVGPLHILQELKWVVERTLGSSQDDEVAVEAAVKLLARGGRAGGSDWGKVSGGSSMRPAEGRDKASVVNGDASADEETPSPGSVSEEESAPLGNAVTSNAVRLRVAARREAALRDMLAFASDGEGMDGPQVDWRMIKDDDGMKLWRAAVPGTVWCMIRTRATVPAPPLEVLTYLLNDNCISEYDELFDKIKVIEPVDESSTFKRTCYKPIWPTAPRDFSLLSSWGTLEDGTAYLLNRSVDHPMNPPVKGYVRGVVMLCSFLMVPRAPDSGDSCTITMIVHTDLGGNLPASLINMLSTSSPWRLMLRLRGAFQSTDGRPTRAAAAAASTAPIPATCAIQASNAPLNGDITFQSR